MASVRALTLTPTTPPILSASATRESRLQHPVAGGRSSRQLRSLREATEDDDHDNLEEMIQQIQMACEAELTCSIMERGKVDSEDYDTDIETDGELKISFLLR